MVFSEVTTTAGNTISGRTNQSSMGGLVGHLDFIRAIAQADLYPQSKQQVPLGSYVLGPPRRRHHCT